MGNQKHAVAGSWWLLVAIAPPRPANCFTQNQIARLIIFVALQKYVRDPFCETAETIEHFILPMSHKSEYVNFDRLK